LHKAQADQDHRLDRHPHGDVALAEVLRDHGIDLFNQAQLVHHARHQSMMVERVTRVGVGVGVGCAKIIWGRHRSIRLEIRNFNKGGCGMTVLTGPLHPIENFGDPWRTFLSQWLPNPC
jgi:hypothetical protein